MDFFSKTVLPTHSFFGFGSETFSTGTPLVPALLFFWKKEVIGLVAFLFMAIHY